MDRGEGALIRVSQEERRLVYNYRHVNPVRQDTLLYFSDELVKLEALERAGSANVVNFSRRKEDSGSDQE